MKSSFSQMSCLLLVACLVSPLSFAHDDEQQTNYQQPQQQDDLDIYFDKVGDKARYGATNMASAILEIPKSIINLTNDGGVDGVVFGVFGGIIEGSIQMTNRFLVGLMDVITAPILTKRNTEPEYIWNDFDEPTTYGKVFRLQDDFNSKQVASDIYIETTKLGDETGDFFETLFDFSEDSDVEPSTTPRDF